MGPEPEAVLNLFDSSWFYLSIFETPLKPPISDPNPNPNPNPQIQQIPSKLHVPRPLTIRARSKSDQLQITSLGYDTDSPPNPPLETILSGREIDSVETPRYRRAPARKTKKKRFSKSLSELEFEEMKGFMDLGFVFSEADKQDSDLVEIVPGLQKLGLGMGCGVDEMCRPRTRPYLSEAWEVESPVTKWRLPAVVGNEIDMKDSLKWWAHTVASAVR